MSDETLSAFQRVCLAETIDAADVAVLEQGGGGPHGRLLLYRELVRIRLRDLHPQPGGVLAQKTRQIGGRRVRRVELDHRSGEQQNAHSG